MLRGFAMRRPRKADSMSLYSQRNSTRKIRRALVESPHTSGYASRESIRNFLKDLPVRITRKLAWVTSCRLLLQVLNVRFVSTGIGRNQRGPQMRICAGVPILNWSLFSCILDMLVLWCVKLLQNVANFCPEEKSFGVLPDGGLPSSIRGRDGTWWHDGTVGRILNPATFTWRIQALWTFPAWLIAPFFKLSLRCAWNRCIRALSGIFLKVDFKIGLGGCSLPICRTGGLVLVTLILQVHIKLVHGL